MGGSATLLSTSGVPLPTAVTPQLPSWLYKGTSKPSVSQNFSEAHSSLSSSTAISLLTLGMQWVLDIHPSYSQGCQQHHGQSAQNLLLSHLYTLRAAREILALLKLVLKLWWSGKKKFQPLLPSLDREDRLSSPHGAVWHKHSDTACDSSRQHL